jgi:hypothetical protein
VQVKVSDLWVGGLSARRVLNALQTGEDEMYRLQILPEALKDAEVVVMFVNPVESINPEVPLDMDGCFISKLPESCSVAAFEQYVTDLKAIWALIFELRAGQPIILRATDIYNPLVSRWIKFDVYEPCHECWQNMSVANRLAAEAFNIPFLSRYDTWNGEDHLEDPREKGFTLDDDEHPSDLGVAYTVEMLAKLGYEPVTPP